MAIVMRQEANFLPKQLTALELMWKHEFVLYGGARGPGKSYWLRWAALIYLLTMWQKYGKTDVTAGLFCETYPELRDRQIAKIETEFPLELGELKTTQERGLGFHLREEYGGGFLALRNLDKPKKYQSAEFAMIAVDELTKSELKTFNILRGSKRWPGVHHTPFIAATNPGGIGHLWVKDYWIDKIYPAELKSRESEFAFVQALPKDNPYLTEEYWEELDSLPPDLYAAWVEGNWDIFEGQAFSSWNRDRHTAKYRELPSWWPRWRAVDWGFSKPFCCLWFAKDPDTSRIYVYREIYQAGLSDRQQAVAIVENTPPEENIQVTFADPSMWAKKSVEDVVTSTATIYSQNGVPLTKADNDRLSGKRKVDRVLQSLPDGEPGIIVFKNCRDLIRTLPALPYDETKVEDVDTDAEDHAYDTLRYGLTKIREQKKQTQRQLEREQMIRRKIQPSRKLSSLL